MVIEMKVQKDNENAKYIPLLQCNIIDAHCHEDVVKLMLLARESWPKSGRRDACFVHRMYIANDESKRKKKRRESKKRNQECVRIEIGDRKSLRIQMQCG